MTYRIEIPTDIVERSVDKALSVSADSRGDFFHELRNAFRKKVGAIFNANGLTAIPNGTLGCTNYLKYGVQQRWGPIIKFTGWNNDIEQELDFDFCARYGHDDHSLTAINYIDRTPALLPSLSSLSGVFSIGNVLLLVKNEDCEVELSLGDGIHSTGYAYHISKRKKKSYLCLFGIWFEPYLIDPIISDRLSTYKEAKEDLDEIRLAAVSAGPDESAAARFGRATH